MHYLSAKDRSGKNEMSALSKCEGQIREERNVCIIQVLRTDQGRTKCLHYPSAKDRSGKNEISVLSKCEGQIREERNFFKGEGQTSEQNVSKGK